jgi:D-inositol-3-phosphate glycosyltransferase
VAEADRLTTDRAARRIAVISMHTSPTASLGQNANGGLNVYVQEVAASFSERGIATDIFTRRQSPDDPSIEQLAPLSRVVYLPAGGGLDKYSMYAEVPGFARSVVRFAEREGIAYDLLFSHYWLSGEVACLLRPRLAASWAHIAHTLGLIKNRTLASGARAEPPSRIRVEAEIAREADLLIASTEDESLDLVNLYGADPERVFVVPPGVDLTMFQPIDRVEARRKIGYGPERLVLFVGRLERLKGVDVAIHALALLRDRNHDDVRLLILGEDSKDGDESEKERLKAVATEAGVRDRVDFLGSVAHHELPYFYSAADLTVMPSYSESFGLVALEAQACGRPVVASNVSGLRSVVRDDVSGYLVDNQDPAAYAERIGRLLDDPELAAQMGARGRLLAQRFSWTRTADRLELLFERVAEHAQLRVHASARQE